MSHVKSKYFADVASMIELLHMTLLQLIMHSLFDIHLNSLSNGSKVYENIHSESDVVLSIFHENALIVLDSDVSLHGNLSVVKA